jgi:hypothetical protein
MILLITFLFLNLYNANENKETFFNPNRFINFNNYYILSKDYIKNHSIKNLIHIINHPTDEKYYDFKKLKYSNCNNMIILEYFPAKFSQKTTEVYQEEYSQRSYTDKNFNNFIKLFYLTGLKEIEPTTENAKNILKKHGGIILISSCLEKQIQEKLKLNDFALTATVLFNQLEEEDLRIFMIGDINLIDNNEKNTQYNTLEKVWYDLSYSLKYIEKTNNKNGYISSREDKYVIFCSKEIEMQIKSTIEDIKYIKNEFSLITKESNFFNMANKVINFFDFYISILSMINYVEQLSDWEKYKENINNLTYFTLTGIEKEILENRLFINELLELKIALKKESISDNKYDIFLHFFKKNTSFLKNTIFGMYIFKDEKGETIDYSIIPHKIIFLTDSEYDDYTVKNNCNKTEYLEGFDKKFVAKYSEKFEGKIVLQDLETNKYYENKRPKLNCWGLAYPTAFLAESKNSKYKACNIFPMGCINSDLSYYTENTKFSSVGACGFKIDDVLNTIKNNRLEKNIILFSHEQLPAIKYYQSCIEEKLQELEKLALTEYELSTDQITSLNKEEYSNYDNALKELNTERKSLLDCYFFYKFFLLNDINYVRDTADLEEKFTNPDAPKLILFSHTIIPEKLPEIFFRKIGILYSLTQTGKGEFRETIFDHHEKNFQIIEDTRKKYNLDNSLIGFILKKYYQYFK